MRFLWPILAVVFLSVVSGAQQSSLHEIKIDILNPSDHARYAEDIVIPFAQLRQLAPEINAGSLMVIADQADLSSQVDDLDGDGKADELVFQIDLQPRQRRRVQISYGEPDAIYRLRNDYPKQTYALFAD